MAGNVHLNPQTLVCSGLESGAVKRVLLIIVKVLLLIVSVGEIHQHLVSWELFEVMSKPHPIASSSVKLGVKSLGVF